MMQAGGTLERSDFSIGWRLWLAVELVVLFVAAPIVMHKVIQAERIPMFVALLPVLAFAALMLVADRGFQLRQELRVGFSALTGISIVGLAAIGGALAAYWLKHHHPNWYLEFPTNRPERYRQVMLLYPFFSVAAQELVYRTFYFHRYGPVFGAQHWAGVLANGVLFGFAHIVVGSPEAVIATFFGGLLLALRYQATRSFWAVFLEHTLWGWLIFTIGLGRFFFTGVANVH